MNTNLQFVQLNSSINPSFWNKLSELKLDVYKLKENEEHIWGYFTVIGNKNYPHELLTFLEVDSTSFNKEFNGQNQYVPFHGKIINKNTMDSFKECDKTALINQEGKIICEDIRNGRALENPSLLNKFLIISFADLKKYHFYYWFAFPVPKDLIVEMVHSNPITDEFSEQSLVDVFNEYKNLDDEQKGYFMIYNKKDGIELFKMSDGINNKHFKKETNRNKFYFVFHNIAFDNGFVGSQLRNFVALVLSSCTFLQNKIVNFIAFHITRQGPKVTCRDSVIYKLQLPSLNNNAVDTLPTWVGWEKNERDRMGPRLAKMRDTLDPQIIAENSVDLNLKLMKWNLLPDVNLEKVKKSKYLLLGAGTLGCSVARTLLGWGVRNITFVDNSTVSFSNPVRQSLYTYQDSVKMRPKAVAAADNLKTIFPGVNSKGIQLTIPMPGHTIGESMLAQTEENVKKLIELIKDHDVIFLLLDSRESRWLPTLLGSMEQKIVINAALGFDSFLVMRHGIFDPSGSSSSSGNNEEVATNVRGLKAIRGGSLACYFCSDVTAPGNSMKERTLDQQCTVTRPGVSLIAGALAVELAISVLQHKKGILTPAYYTTTASFGAAATETPTPDQSVLGLVPHSIRGFLSSFEQILPATEKYEHCVACSNYIIAEYQAKGMDFLMSVFNSSKHLEDVALLTDMFNQTDFAEILELNDEDDLSSEG